MKTSKEQILDFIQKEILVKNDVGIDTKTISDSLGMHRSNVSAALNELVKEGVLSKTDTRPVLYGITSDNNNILTSSFDKLIGNNGSLRNAIQLAKAAMLYPHKSLNVLFSSKNGCGTSTFAYTMFDFAIENGVFPENAPVVKLNCRNYSKDISELTEDLFGNDNDFSTSIFNRARGGLLFIDNVDLLDAKQQSRLMEFIDTQCLFSLNREKYEKYDDILLVLACSPQSESQFNRKIPVIINLPELKDRPLEERLELIDHFFTIEATNSNSVVEVTTETVKALMLSSLSYNVKELLFEIKSACANAYVRSVNDKNLDIKVYLTDFKNEIRKGLLREKELTPSVLRELEISDLRVYYKYDDKSSKIKHNDNKDVYAEIKKQYDELYDRGINTNSIENVINSHIQFLFRKYRYYYVYNKPNDLDQLSKIVDSRIIDLVSTFLESCRKQLSKEFKQNVFYGLCLHINSLISMHYGSQRVNNDQIIDIIQNYPKEYALSAQFCEVLKYELELDLPIEEITIIAMFMIETDEVKNKGNPVLLYILHGNSAASSLRDVTNALTQCNNAYSYDLKLEVETEKAMEEIKQLIHSIDEGEGVIVIYDMGSIKTMIDSISEEINVKIRAINIPITLLGIDLARKCSMENDIDYVYHLANMEMNHINRNQQRYTDIIVTLCHTGEGGAMQMKRYINQYSKLGYRVVPLAISQREKLLKEVMELQRTYRIHTFVGTYNPNLFGIPFISIAKLFENSHENIDKILMFEPVDGHGIDYSEVYSYLEEQFKYVSIPKLKSVLPEVLDDLNVLYSPSNDQRIGLFMHLACLIERLLDGNLSSENIEKSKLFSVFKDEYLSTRKILRKLEKAFNVIIDDNEIATIIMIIKKI